MEKSADGIVGVRQATLEALQGRKTQPQPGQAKPQRQTPKARTVPRKGIEREEKSPAKEQQYCIRRAHRTPVRWLDEAEAGAAGNDAPVSVHRPYAMHVDSICRTADYVTRSYGGVGGGSREASTYPE